MAEQRVIVQHRQPGGFDIKMCESRLDILDSAPQLNALSSTPFTRLLLLQPL